MFLKRMVFESLEQTYVLKSGSLSSLGSKNANFRSVPDRKRS